MPAAVARPLLRADAAIVRHGDRVVLAGRGIELEVNGEAASAVQRALLRFDGLSTPEAVSAEIGLDPGVVQGLAALAISHDLVVDADTADAGVVGQSQFGAACKRMFPLWKQAVFTEELWAGLVQGTVPRSVFLGWLVESYHFIQGVSDRLALAVTHASHPALRELLAQHFVEEYDHARYFVNALTAVGVDTEALPGTRPLPSTLAVLNHMRSAARGHTAEYLVCSGLLESSAHDQLRAREFLCRVEAHYAPRGALAPLVEHVALDDDYGHPDNFVRACAVLGPLPAATSSRALESGFLLAETLRLWSRDIMRTYSAGPALRLGLHQYRPSHALTRPLDLDGFNEDAPWR